MSDGYVNSRVAKLDKDGDWIKSWGKYGGRPERRRKSLQHRQPAQPAGGSQGNVYVADRGNRRIQVFDTDGNFKRFLS